MLFEPICILESMDSVCCLCYFDFNNCTSRNMSVVVLTQLFCFLAKWSA